MVTALLLGSAQAYADELCGGYLGKSVRPETFDELASALGHSAPKGEFETTADYQKRLASAWSGGSRIVSKEVKDPQFFEYDADQNLLRIKIYAFHNQFINFWSAFYTANPDLKASTGENIGAVISQKDVPLGSFEAQNGYGAHVTVVRVHRTTDAIFDREARFGTAPDYRYETVFPSDSNGYVGHLSMSPVEAKILKPQIRIAFVVEPRSPFMVSGEHQPLRVTMRNPIELTEKFRILVANIRCGLVMDGMNKVLASYASTKS